MSHDKRTSAELAELLDLSTWSVSRRINGHHAFKIDELQSIAEWLGVPLESITQEEHP